MATGESDHPAAREAELARLPGPKLVEHLRNTHRRADYEAVARVLDARDRRLVAALAENEALLSRYGALLDAQRPRPRPTPREEAAEEKPRHGIATTPTQLVVPARRDEPGAEEPEEGEVVGAHYIDLCRSSDDDDGEVEAGRGAGSTSRPW